MPKMHTLQISSVGIETDGGARHNPKTRVPKVRTLVQDTGSTIRRVNKKNRSSTCASTEEEQQWPFPTKLIVYTGKPVKFNSENYEGALF
jgi:hypothetical protein